MNFEKFEQWMKRNKITSTILFTLFILTTMFSISDVGNKTWIFFTMISGYEPPIMVKAIGNGMVEKRLNLAKLESVNYKIPSSSIFVIKFLTLPMLNNFNKNFGINDSESTHAVVTSVSPIKPTMEDIVFDGADCHFGIEASSFDQEALTARLELVSLACTDNQGYVYSNEAKSQIGYLSDLGNPNVASVKTVDDDGYLTVDPDKNYLAQLYTPIESIKNRGISFFGRF